MQKLTKGTPTERLVIRTFQLVGNPLLSSRDVWDLIGGSWSHCKASVASLLEVGILERLDTTYRLSADLDVS
jgi:hypothetical protein